MQVFATYPNEDYDRRNEDVDPMAASAEYELEKRVERLDLFPVELEKGEPSAPRFDTQHGRREPFPMLWPPRAAKHFTGRALNLRPSSRSLTSNIAFNTKSYTYIYKRLYLYAHTWFSIYACYV